MYTNQPNLQDVIVRPTANQLNAALETMRYSQSARSHSRCPITLEDFAEGDEVTRIRPCGHVFHTQSIRNWFSNRVRCPVCRYDIREYSEPARADVSNNIPNTHPTSAVGASAGEEIEQSLNGLTENISNLIASYFANNADLSNNQTFRFEIPIVTTYEVQEDSDDAEEDANNAADDNSDE
jgi:hypothetical protein